MSPNPSTVSSNVSNSCKVLWIDIPKVTSETLISGVHKYFQEGRIHTWKYTDITYQRLYNKHKFCKTTISLISRIRKKNFKAYLLGIQFIREDVQLHMTKYCMTCPVAVYLCFVTQAFSTCPKITHHFSLQDCTRSHFNTGNEKVENQSRSYNSVLINGESGARLRVTIERCKKPEITVTGRIVRLHSLIIDRLDFHLTCKAISSLTIVLFLQ